MSSGTHFYNFANQEELKKYLGDDLRRMAYLILSQGIVCEEQCEKLTSYLIEEYGSSMLMHVLSEETNRNIIPDYDQYVHLYFLYDYENLSREEAFQKCSQWYEIFENGR